MKYQKRKRLKLFFKQLVNETGAINLTLTSMEHACITHNINGNIKVNRTILTNPGQKLGHLFEAKQLKHEVMTSLKSTIWNLTL